LPAARRNLRLTLSAPSSTCTSRCPSRFRSDPTKYTSTGSSDTKSENASTSSGDQTVTAPPPLIAGSSMPAKLHTTAWTGSSRRIDSGMSSNMPSHSTTSRLPKSTKCTSTLHVFFSTPAAQHSIQCLLLLHSGTD